MPTPMIHLSVAKNLYEKIKSYDAPGFYLGAVSPDAVHLVSDYITFSEKDVEHKFV